MSQRRFIIVFSGLITVYLVVGLAQAYYHQWNLYPDGLAYLQIARRFADGEWVVRGYWSPLISWLAAILIRLGIPPEMAIRVVIVASGVVALRLIVVLGGQLGLSRLARFMAALVSAILMLSLQDITADVIGVAVLLAYLCILTRPAVLTHPVRYGLLAGILGGIAYLARSYNLTFIAAHLLIYIAWMWVQRHSLKPLFRLIPALLAGLMIISLPYIAALSNRYGALTFSTSAAHTRGLVAPGAQGSDSIVCFNGERLCDQPDDVQFPFEDHLPELQPNYDWSPFASAENFTHQIRLIGRNALNFVNINRALAAALLVSVLCMVWLWRQRESIHRGLFLLTSALLYAGGYLLTLSTGGIRYFLAAYLLLIVLLLINVQQVTAHIGLRGKVGLFALTGLLFGGAILPAALDVASTLQNVLAGTRLPGRCQVEDAQTAAPFLTEPFATVGGSFRLHMDIAYHAQSRSVGFLDPAKHSFTDIVDQLREHGASSVIVFNDADLLDSFSASGYQAVAPVTFCGEAYTVFAPPPETEPL